MNLNEEIINLLKENSRYSNQYIADRLSVSEGTIRNRIGNLVENGKIKRFTIKTSNQIGTVCLIETDPKVKTEDIVGGLLKIKEITNLKEVSGSITIVCDIESSSMEKINDIIEKIRATKGVLNTNTHTVLKSY